VWVRCERNEIVFRDKLIEFRYGHSIVRPVNEGHKIEDVATLSSSRFRGLVGPR